MSIEKINIREINENDLSQVVELVVRLKSVNEELDPNFKIVNNIYDVVSKYVKDSVNNENVVFLVAEDENEKTIAGIIRFIIIDRLFYEPRIKAEITDFYVKPIYRRKRLGAMLLQKAIEYAKLKGAGIVTAIYPAGNNIADSFYDKQGFISLNKEKYKSCM
ncbi:acetyltransferase [Caldisphaera lagunensis DSM 15908]|uniref:Acetyltransferase n=1 Tax=Caldisphaera lagunensis (strain DSM 15908 / JCM 11604 / ANMR 0165 / IC-154) TaxID=1056495 RepID=L0A9C9_CALLD|nr:GNAT family N-acetyltransferase [Caldisphaera lagunensis]AFZ70029.1 acetyltransferase [Caldisphaera lagunensis DSM 15908]